MGALGREVRIPEVEEGEPQVGIQLGNGTPNPPFGLGGWKICRGELNPNIDPIGRNRSVDGLFTMNGVAHTARPERKRLYLLADIGLRLSGYTTDAVAAHLGLRPVGVEHPHAILVADTYREQQAIHALLVGAKGLDECRVVGQCFELRMGNRVEHQEAISRAVTSYVFDR